jgi:hypothetical protein
MEKLDVILAIARRIFEGRERVMREILGQGASDAFLFVYIFYLQNWATGGGSVKTSSPSLNLASSTYSRSGTSRAPYSFVIPPWLASYFTACESSPTIPKDCISPAKHIISQPMQLCAFICHPPQSIVCAEWSPFPFLCPPLFFRHSPLDNYRQNRTTHIRFPSSFHHLSE